MDFIYRQREKDILRWIDERPFIIIKGARRVGKTFLMKKIYKQITAPAAFLLCDDLLFIRSVHTPDDLIFLLTHRYSFVKGEKFFLFLDEFQVLENSGLFLKNIYDRYPEIKIIASGSSSLEITKNTEFLTGRSVEFLLQPLSFLEYYSFYRKQKITIGTSFEEKKQYYDFFQSDIEKSLIEYIAWGGYPEIVLQSSEEKKKTLLQEYINKYIEKDIIHFLRIENISAFNSLLRFLAEKIGDMVNENEIANTLQITNATAKKYIDIMEGTYVFSRLRPFFRNIRSEISKMPKSYYTDLGLRNMLLQKNNSIIGQINLGAEAENLVFSKLHDQKYPLHFWRTIGGAEIDFIQEKEDNIISAIEVKYRNSLKLGRGFKSFCTKYESYTVEKIIITKDICTIKKGIEYIPLGLFLLG